APHPPGPEPPHLGGPLSRPRPRPRRRPPPDLAWRFTDVARALVVTFPGALSGNFRNGSASAQPDVDKGEDEPLGRPPSPSRMPPMTHRFTVSCALLTLMSVVACGSDSENGGSSGTGGTAPGSSGGDTAASGGDTSTTGGAPGTGGVVQGGGGMDGTGGGGPGPVSICPPGSESLTLEPGDVSAGPPIATPPDLGSDGQHVNLEGP